MTYYDAYAEELVRRYEALKFEEVHADILDAVPNVASNVLDVGAGSGRDAAALARRGHRVVAVEPSEAMRREGRAIHGTGSFDWIDDQLPRLDEVYRLNESFDLILVSAVWMHVAPEDRDLAMQRLQGLLVPGGRLVITTRTVEFSGERTMYAVEPERLGQRAQDHGLDVERRQTSSDLLGRSDVSWSSLVFRRPDRGVAALPTLRNVIVNDSKSSTYKLGLLRALCRVAAGASGLVRRRDDGFCDVPLGLVALYWAKSYWQPMSQEFEQQAYSGQVSSFRAELLEAADTLSIYDLRVGNSLKGSSAEVLHALLRSVRSAIRDGPSKYTTYSGTKEPIFIYEGGRAPTGLDALELGPEYLRRFGTLRIPTDIYESLERNWVWIEPAIVDEWANLMQRYESGDRRDEAYRDALKWRAGDRRDTQQVSNIVTRLLEQETDLSAVWTGEAIVDSDQIEIDHCIPYSLWGNNSLWNLLPSTKAANQKKRHRIPSRELLSGSRERNRIVVGARLRRLCQPAPVLHRGHRVVAWSGRRYRRARIRPHLRCTRSSGRSHEARPAGRDLGWSQRLITLPQSNHGG